MSSVEALRTDNPMSEEQKRILKENGTAPETTDSQGTAAPSSTVNVFPSDERQQGHYGLSDPESNPYKPLPVDSSVQQEQASSEAVSDDDKYHDAQAEATYDEPEPSSGSLEHRAVRSTDSFRSAAPSSSSGKAPLEDANIGRSSDDIREDGSVPFEASEPVQLDRITEAGLGGSRDTAGTNEAAAGGTGAVAFEPIKLNPVNVTSESSERTPVTDTEPETRHEQPSSSGATGSSSSGDTYTTDTSTKVSASDAPHPPHAEAMTETLERQEAELEESGVSSGGGGVTGGAGSSSGSGGTYTADASKEVSVSDAPHPPHAEAMTQALEHQEQELTEAQSAAGVTDGSGVTDGGVTDSRATDTLGERAAATYTLEEAPDTTNMQEINLDSNMGGSSVNDDTASTVSVERGEQAPSTAAVTASPAPNARDLTTDVNTPVSTRALPAPPAASPADQAPTAEADEDSNDESDEEVEQPTVQVPVEGGNVSKGDAGAGIRRTIRDTPHSVKAKVDELDMIREFEAKRTEYYQNQIRAHTIYWVAMKEMINRRGQVTERLLTWYNKRLTVYKHFAEGLFARNDAMAGDKKGASMKTAMLGDSFASRAEPLQQKHYKSNSSKPLGAAGAQQGGGALQDELCAMDCSIATVIEQMCAYLENKVGSVLAQQHGDTMRETQALVKEGDHALSTLDQVENYTLKAYETRHRLLAPYAAAAANDNDRTAADGMVRPTEYMEHSQGAARRDASGDMWLADTNYRVAVAQQKAAWDSVAALMSRLFSKLRDAELERRKYTRAALEEMLRVQTDAWKKLPATQDPVLTCLGRIDVDPMRLEKDLKDETRMWANSEQAQAYNAPPVSELEGDSPPVQSNPEFITSLSDPLQSPFVLDAAVLKRKDKGMVKSSWTSTLVVLTSDHFLHMFDCPTLQPGTDPKEAFGIILPAIDPRERFNADKDDKKAAVLPSQSLDLSSHMIGPRGKQTKAEHSMQFHIIEVQENSGFKRFIKSQSQHKASLRTRTTAEMQHWMGLITSLCDPTAANAPLTAGTSSEHMTVPEV